MYLCGNARFQHVNVRLLYSIYYRDLQKHLADFHAVATRVCAERMKLALHGELLKTETRIRDVQDLKDYDVLELHLEMCNTDSVTSSKIFVYDQFCTIDPPHDSKNVPVNTKPTITFNNYLGWEIFAGDMVSSDCCEVTLLDAHSLVILYVPYVIL